MNIDKKFEKGKENLEMKKKTVALIFGGQSPEHEISCISAQTIIKHISQEDYQLVLVGITKKGSWLWVDSLSDIEKGTWREGEETAILSPQSSNKCIYRIKNDQVTQVHIDVVFPILHGTYGEDGTIQGILELAQIPYVGCGVLASCISMDKSYTKIILNHINIQQANYMLLRDEDRKDFAKIKQKVQEKFNYPVFIKPSRTGSSIGISKVSSEDDLEKAIQLAFSFDQKILIEEYIEGREI